MSKAKRKNIKAQAPKPRQTKPSNPDPIIRAIQQHVVSFYACSRAAPGLPVSEFEALIAANTAVERKFFKVVPTTRDGLDALILHAAKCYEVDEGFLYDGPAVKNFLTQISTATKWLREKEWTVPLV